MAKQKSSTPAVEKEEQKVEQPTNEQKDVNPTAPQGEMKQEDQPDTPIEDIEVKDEEVIQPESNVTDENKQETVEFTVLDITKAEPIFTKETPAHLYQGEGWVAQLELVTELAKQMLSDDMIEIVTTKPSKENPNYVQKVYLKK